jgi:hypothetical protein
MEKGKWYAGASELEQRLFRNWVHSVLKTASRVEVVFEKADGSERIMNCTLSEEYLEDWCMDEPSTNKSKTKSTDAITVFDTDIDEWRSFRFDKIKTFSFEL